MPQLIADLHIHSKYSRACSPELTLSNIDKWCRIKGIDLISTGDFTHPIWFKNIVDELIEEGSGFLRLRESDGAVKFILGTEVSCIYSQGGQTRRIHLCLFFPDLASVEKFNAKLTGAGKNLRSDGRPILGMSAKQVLTIMKEITPRAVMIPAHCLVADSYLQTKNGIKKIIEINKGDLILTHKNRWKKIQDIFKRPYKGKTYLIRPYYFRIGLETTPEHPFYAISTFKKCSWTKGYCRQSCSQKKACKKLFFNKYQPKWIQAKDLKQSDVLLYPRFNIKETNLKKLSLKINHEFRSREKRINKIISINEDFCRLIGYYLAEGYTNQRDCVAFCFRNNEKKYITDVKRLMNKIFNIQYTKERHKKGTNSTEIIFYSKVLNNFFVKNFYNGGQKCRAQDKNLANWMMFLPKYKQVEIFKGWWRGDGGYTSSRSLMNQMKIILLRLGVIPSIRMDSQKDHERRGHHIIGKRRIKANYDNFTFLNLSFFQDNFNLLKDKEFRQFKTKLSRRHGWIDKNYIYIPIRDITTKKYTGYVYNFEVEHDHSFVSEFAAVHNCWTPWFAVFGSKSGFDSLEECFEELTPEIFAIETGLSSDPVMNWRLSALDKVALVSNSDAHSLPNLGREANIFALDIKKTNYDELMRTIKEKNPARFLSTVEFYPEEGMYHYDGHRACGARLTPAETKKNKGLCPVCKKEVVVGVLNRVEKLADRPEGFTPPNAVPFMSLVELDKIIGEALDIKSRQSAAVQREYQNLIKKGGSEFNVLLNLSYAELTKITLPEIVEGIRRVREKELKIEPGFDGQYGRVSIFSPKEKAERQKSLF